MVGWLVVESPKTTVVAWADTLWVLRCYRWQRRHHYRFPCRSGQRIIITQSNPFSFLVNR